MRSIDLICPVCKSAILPVDDEKTLRCSGNAAHIFPIVRDVPILINDSNSVFAISDYHSQPTPLEVISSGMYNSHDERMELSFIRRQYRKIAQFLTNFTVRSSRIHATDAFSMVAKDVSNPLILILGAGESRYDFPERATCVYTDIAISDGVKYVCDAHDLPFSDEDFDLVIADAVFEHVADPYRVAEEIYRVLGPSGCVYATTPFMQPIHLGVYDFTRFTYAGYRRLFRRFDEICLEPVLGPGCSLGYAMQYFLMSFSSRRNVRSVLNLVGLTMSLPWKYFDKVLLKQKSALSYAAGYAFIGRKSDRTLSDRELVQAFAARIM